MKITQTTISKTFNIKIKNKTYYVNYLNSNSQILGLINRLNWEITEDNGEELNIYAFSSDTVKERKKTENNRKLSKKLINFCIKHFNDYKPLKAPKGKRII